MARYPQPTVNDTQGLFEIFRWVNNTATDGLFFPIILLTIWVIAFIGSLVEGRQAYTAWTFSSFICTIMAVILALMGFLSSTYVYLLVFLTAAGIFWAHLQSDKLS